ncbi:MAG: DAK2 domain-containing protein [Coriobacteriia bacterium]|nr:DAK2 domain-containing protein [Coriobacteriia bacterium]
MGGEGSTPSVPDLISAAAAALAERADEVNRLNVFPVPDGDTGINMSLTMSTVVAEVGKLDSSATLAEVCHAVSHGALMGARGNSGVILSQILRGLCEGISAAPVLDTEHIALAAERSRDVAYQAVRKPVEGTMLTVVADAALAAREAAASAMDAGDALDSIVAAAYRSVDRTPELLPILKENGVVDAGGFGLAILLEGFVGALTGKGITLADSTTRTAGELSVEPVDDWDDGEFLYCTEFLLFGEDVDQEAVGEFVATVGGSELVVGSNGEYKVHVHTNDPGAVLSHVTSMGEVAEVHINNMRRQTAARDELLRQDSSAQPVKEVGFVAVASGGGLAEILTSLGVDVVVNGGQTMNPSTADLVDAIVKTRAAQVIILPNNKNIVMAAQSAATVADRPVHVLSTTSVPQGFAALIAWDGGDQPEASLEEMAHAASLVRTGEVTHAVKDAVGSAGPIKAGQVIGIIDDDDIAVIGEDVADVTLRLAAALVDEDIETLTLFAGADLDDVSLTSLVNRLGESLPGVEIESHRGEQPLYPVILSAE